MPLMLFHYPYPADSVFMCVGYCAPEGDAIDYPPFFEMVVASSPGFAQDLAWGQIQFSPKDARLIVAAGSGAISLEQLRAWRDEAESAREGAEAAGLPLWPRKLFRRFWLASGSMRSEWIRASTVYQTAKWFYRTRREGEWFFSMSEKQLNDWIEKLEAAQVGEGPFLQGQTGQEYADWRPPAAKGP